MRLGGMWGFITAISGLTLVRANHGGESAAEKEPQDRLTEAPSPADDKADDEC